MELLENIAWVFDDTDYPTQELFTQAVMQYQLDMMEDRAQWHPGMVLVEAPAVEIVYEYWATGSDPVFADETEPDETAGEEAEEDEDEEEENEEEAGDDEGEQKEVKMRLTADNGLSFTAAELLYKLHQRLRHRDLGDHIFFEGLHAFGTENLPVPQFYLYCGS